MTRHKRTRRQRWASERNWAIRWTTGGFGICKHAVARFMRDEEDYRETMDLLYRLERRLIKAVSQYHDRRDV